MISAIIVNFKTYDMTCRTIEALLLSEECPKIEIILVDNGSDDNSGEKIFERFSHITYISLPQNCGFARANNAGLLHATGDTILLLNSDVTVNQTTIGTTFAKLYSDSSIGCVGPKLLLPSGDLDHACHRGIPTPWNSLCYFTGLAKLFPSNPTFSGYRMSWLSTECSHPVEAITGAYMLIKKEVIDSIGLFDERYFMYGEDLDLCVRISSAGWKIIFEPSAQAVHHKGSSSKSRPYWLIYEFYRAMFLFHREHTAKRELHIVNLLTYAGIATLLSIAFTKRFFQGLSR